MQTYTQSNWHEPGYYADTEHLVFDLGNYPGGLLINFGRQIDDLLIHSPDGDVLLSWDIGHEITSFNRQKCLLLSQKDNLKEISNLKATLLAIQPKEERKGITVYITAQRN